MSRNSIFNIRGTENVKNFIIKIKILKRLKYDYIVEFIGNYIDSKYIDLIILLVIEINLFTYFKRVDILKY